MHDWVRLAAHVRHRRRIELDLHQDELAQRAQISRRTLASLERAHHPVSPEVQAKLEYALQWAPGSITSILSGGDPSVVPPAEPETLTDPAEQAIWALPSVSSEERWSLILHLRNQRRRRRQTG